MKARARETIGDGLQGVLCFGATFGPAEVRHEDEPAVTFQNALDGWKGLSDSAIVGDVRPVEGHVEIDPHQDALALHIDVGNGFPGH